MIKHKYYVAITLNILMLCFAWVNWHWVTQIFETPENAKSYAWLKKVNQEPKLKTFKKSELPAGEVLKTEQLYAIAQDLAKNPENTQAINTYFKHHYLTNYQSLNSVYYLSGQYRILSIKKLDENDWITQGLAIDLQAIELIHDELSSAWVKYPLNATLLLPQTKANEWLLKVGADIELNSSQAMSIVHLTIPKLHNTSLPSNFNPKVTIIPLGQHLNLTGQTKLISISPAQEFNMQALASE